MGKVGCADIKVPFDLYSLLYLYCMNIKDSKSIYVIYRLIAILAVGSALGMLCNFIRPVLIAHAAASLTVSSATLASDGRTLTVNMSGVSGSLTPSSCKGLDSLDSISRRFLRRFFVMQSTFQQIR